METDEYIMQYKLNPKTGRMNKYWKCKAIGCGKEFQRHSSIVNHLGVHRTDKPYACNICNKRFVQKGNRDRHMKLMACLKCYKIMISNEEFKEQLDLVRDSRKKDESSSHEGIPDLDDRAKAM